MRQKINKWKLRTDHLMKKKLPKYVYKYRDWTDHFHKTIITARQVYFAPPKSFPDPLDCKLLPRYDLLTEKEIYNKYLNLSKKDDDGWTRQQHRKFARQWTKSSPLKNKEQIKRLQEEDFDEFDSRFGVLSMTANPCNIEMWKSYASNHTGFCIGFKSIILFNDPEHFGGGGEVIYYNELPIIHPNDSFEEQSTKQTFSKEIKWEFEEEYRLHKFWQAPADRQQRTATVPSDAYYEIIFGAKMTEEQKQEIKNAVDIATLTVQYRQAVLLDNEIKIKIE